MWYTYPSEKYEFVSWDDDYSQLNGKSYKIHVPNHQPVMVNSWDMYGKYMEIHVLLADRKIYMYATHILKLNDCMIEHLDLTQPKLGRTFSRFQQHISGHSSEQE